MEGNGLNCRVSIFVHQWHSLYFKISVYPDVSIKLEQRKKMILHLQPTTVFDHL